MDDRTDKTYGVLRRNGLVPVGMVLAVVMGVAGGVLPAFGVA
jgi:hypothetical protein